MPNFNNVVFIGHLTADPMFKQVGQGTVGQFTLAANRKGKRKDGSVSEEVCFIDIEVWNSQADVAKKFLKRGSAALVAGRLKQAKWQAKDGTERSKHIIVCETLQLIGGANTTDNTTTTTTTSKPATPKSAPAKQEEFDDLPF